MNEVDIAYIAGLFDGEGCISIAKCAPRYEGCSPYYRLVVALVNTNEQAPRLLQSHFGGRVYLYGDNKSPRQGGTARPCWHWRAGGPECVEFLRVVSPYLKLKANEARLALKFAEARASNKSRFHGEGLSSAEIAAMQEDYLRSSSMKGKRKPGATTGPNNRPRASSGRGMPGGLP